MSHVEVKPVQENTPEATSLLSRVQELTTKVRERTYQLFEARGHEPWSPPRRLVSSRTIR